MNATMSLENLKHFPVMLEKLLSIITPQHGGTYIDCTFGAGGYTKKILSFPNTEVLAIDRDPSSIYYAKPLKDKYKNRFKFYNKKFTALNSIIKTSSSYKAIVFDLGFSMMQMKDLSRGFSFNSSGPLDMRMGLNTFKAEKIINELDQKKIEQIFKFFGEEKNSKRIAFEIINQRNKKKLNTQDLVKLINKVKRKKYNRINEATKCFQALRIIVNNEISELIYGLIEATKLLKPGGILLVVTFHSIEDKIVKHFFRFYSELKNYSRYIPDANTKKDVRLFNCPERKAIKASEKEILLNPPSRSAKLRYALRNDNNFFFPEDFIEKFKNYLDLEKVF